MLHNISPLLTPDLLWSLRAMGHGDEVAIVDANFPATSHSTRCHRLDGIPATQVLEAILSVMPLDTFVPDPAATMQVVGDAAATPDIVSDFQDIINRTADAPVPVAPIERFAFYDRAKQAFAIIQTGETRLYGNIIVKKGVISP